ncbi:hypothetical protein PIN31009_05577 [Pandoraea iniqua]|uniref:Lar family restriction alleviation protein n=1 Tax=Pandoraea iniqua TaxID=2508288 RepID=UPI001252E8D1|nr:Lar family restriction alleviation protein [Pandoraea iniqua]VVE59534.1 hypothetical protein PIN31009_05577 [Pandoraea iniqua]
MSELKTVTFDATLLPCPFCGCENILIAPDEYGSGGQHVSPYHIVCRVCKTEQSDDEPESAIAKWNTRPPTPVAQSAGQEPVAWFTDDHLIDKSATTWDKATAERWAAKGWPVWNLYRSMPRAGNLGDGLRKFLDAAAGDGLVCNGVDAADLYVELFGDTLPDAAAERAADAQQEEK